ncbi:hypothetical protein [Demequina sediminis]|nr:hypothetical protein [Demequina sediminis]
MLAVGMMAGGFALIFIVAYSETEKSSGALWWKKTTEVPLSERLPYLFISITLFIAAATAVVMALRLLGAQSRMQKYLTVTDGVESIEIRQLVEITNTSRAKVYRDLEALISSGMASDLYIDYQGQRLVRRSHVPKNSRKATVRCTSCGGSNDIIVGSAKKCDYCLSALPLDLT